MIRKLLAGASLAAMSTVAFAQTAPAPAPANGIGDIVVTATRTQSSAQKTAIALTVYNGQALVSAGVRSVQGLQSIDPSLNVTSSTGAAYVAIRGVASTDVTEIGDPAVPIARDDFFTNRSYSIGSSLYDVERIEVLKGPQGTLFGRNSTGGLVNIITAKPGKTFGGYLSADGGNYSTYDFEGAVNAPLGDKVQLRLSGVVRHHDGYRQLTGVNQRGDDEDSQSGRVQLAFQPVDGFKGWLSYQHDNTNDVGDVAENLPLATVTPYGDVKSFAAWEPTSNKLVGNRERWEFSYDKLPGGLTLTYAGGLDEQDWRHALDATGSASGPLSQFVQHEHPRTWNHEVRIATRSDQRFTFQGGFFHFEEHNVLSSGLQEDAGAFAGQDLIYFPYDVKTTSNAVFGQVGFKVTDDLKLTFGARYTHDTKTRTGDSVLRCDIAGIPSFVWPFIGCVGTPPALTTLGNGNISESKPTFHVGVEWTARPGSLVYAKFDTGFKSGGFNSNGSAPSVNYGPEGLSAFEIGTKNRFLDEKLQLNADIFYERYTGYQASQVTAVISGSSSGVFNLPGASHIYGAEAQAIALLGDFGRLDANATVLSTRIASGDMAVDGGGTNRAIGGNRLPNAPSFVMTAGFEHAFDMGTAKLTARMDGKYSSSFYYDVFNFADTQSHAYAIANASLTYAPAGGRWELQAYARNFTDSIVLAHAARNYVAFANTYEFQPPRTFGARVKVKF